MTDDGILEELEELDSGMEAAAELSESISTAPASEPDRALIASFLTNPLPILIMDSNLRISDANEACERLFENFYHLKGGRFLDVFGKSLGVEALKEFVLSVKSPERGYSWKGLIRSKIRESGTILTKTYLFPLYAKNDREHIPPSFVVFFDDVTEENRALLRAVFLSLLEASKLKDNDTGKHIQRVNLYSERMALELFDKPGYEEIDKDFIDDIGFLAAMHDVGKIGTPDDVLNKEGPLADWEWTIMKEHTKNGAYILSTYPNPMAREIALYHHERWDGSGYPYSLEGKMIPLASRIVAVADVYDALRMKRSYKNAFDHETAVRKVREWSGTHFDPSLAAVFERIENEFEAIYADNAD